VIDEERFTVDVCVCVRRSLGGWGRYLGQMMLSGEAQSVDGVRSTVCPLAKLLRRLCERHVGTDGAVDYCLKKRVSQINMCITFLCSCDVSVFVIRWKKKNN